MLPEGALEDDGADGGIVFIFMGTDLARQFEFIKSPVGQRRQLHWARLPKGPDRWSQRRNRRIHHPVAPIRRRLRAPLTRFVITKGGEFYLFMPGIRALNWLAELDG